MTGRRAGPRHRPPLPPACTAPRDRVFHPLWKRAAPQRDAADATAQRRSELNAPRPPRSAQVRVKLNETATKLFTQVFCALPLGCVLGGKVFVVHGGLFSNDDVKISDLKAINRFREPPDEGPMCEMLWSDPAPGAGRSPSKRGVGVAFGEDVTKGFLERNGLELLVRSHEVKDEGFEVDHGGCCITVFSAPNYCDQMQNKGAFIRFEHDMVPHMTSFAAVVRAALRRGERRRRRPADAGRLGVRR